MTDYFKKQAGEKIYFIESKTDAPEPQTDVSSYYAENRFQPNVDKYNDKYNKTSSRVTVRRYVVKQD